MSRRSDSNILVLVVMGIVGIVYWIIKFLFSLFSAKPVTHTQIIDAKVEKKDYWEERNRIRREESKEKALKEEKRFEELKNKYSGLLEKDLIFNKDISYWDKTKLLQECYKYSYSEAEELLKTAEKQATKAKLQKAKRDIGRKAFELYGGIPSDDKRSPILDEVKQYVWQRDKGKCVKCGGQENLEYDHIIPFSKGGSSTERNIQLLCENCNRSKSDNI